MKSYSLSKLLSLAIAILLFINLSSLKGQIPNMPVDIVPPSPNAASLGKYGQVPVSLFSGITQIGVPIYQVQGRKLSLPISLSYYSSGLKIQERASSYGLGWSLNAGGVITRTVKGLPDETGYFIEKNNFSTYASESNPLNLQTMSEGEYYDLEPDMFFFNFNGYSGRLIFKVDSVDANTSPYGKVVCVPNQDIKITYSKQTGSSNIYKWTLTTPDGSKYIFGNDSYSIEVNNYTPRYNKDAYVNYMQSWYLKQMISYDNTDTINFEYRSENCKLKNPIVYQTNIYVAPGAYQSNQTCYNFQSRTITTGDTTFHNDVSTTISRLTRISFSNGDLLFRSRTDSLRKDMLGDSILSYIEIRQKNGNSYSRIKRYKFSFDYFKGSSAQLKAYFPATPTWAGMPDQQVRLKLKSIQEFGSTDAISKPAWQFYYYNENNIPPLYSYAQDHWGFYNGSDGNTSLFRENPYYPTYPSLERESSSDVTVTQSGTLRSIVYPTKGSTSFIYEPNQAYCSDLWNINNGSLANRFVGGIRIKKIIDYDASNPLKKQIREFEYLTHDTATAGNPSTISSGNLFSIPSYDYSATAIAYISTPPNPGCAKCNLSFTTGFSVVPLTSNDGYHVGYSDVATYYNNGDSTDVNGKGKNGKTITRYDVSMTAPSTYSPYVLQSINLTNGLVNEVTNYEKRSGAYYRTNRTSTTYNTVGTSFYYPEMSVVSNIKPVYNEQYPGQCYDVKNDMISDQIAFNVTNRSINIPGWVAPLSQTVTYYDANQNRIKTLTQFTNVSPARLTKKVEKDVDGKDITSYYSYPNNMGGTGAYPDMISKNMISLVTTTKITETISGTEKVLSAAKTDYSKFNNVTDQIYPSLVSQVELDQPVATTATLTYNPKSTVDSVDAKGNVLQQTKAGDLPQSYVYDPAYPLPTAKAINAAVKQIAFSSFENRSDPAWPEVANAHSIQYSHYHTGKASRRILKGNPTYGPTKDLILKKEQKGKYIFSCWIMTDFVSGFTNGGIDLVAYSLPTPIFSHAYFSGGVSGWRLVQTEIDLSGISDSYFPLTLRAYAFNSDANHDFVIDDMRVYPKDAIMTSYTYSPLIGITSETDANNSTIYYEYDNLNRLSLTKDDNKNIIKRTTYNFKP